jgi:hypothetical protein
MFGDSGAKAKERKGGRREGEGGEGRGAIPTALQRQGKENKHHKLQETLPT